MNRLFIEQHRGKCMNVNIKCAIHGTAHTPHTWVRGFSLNKIGVFFATKLFKQDFKVGDWLCNKLFERLKKNVITITQPKIINETSQIVKQPINEYTIEDEDMLDYVIIDSKRLMDFVENIGCCSNCHHLNCIKHKNTIKSGGDVIIEFSCTNCALNYIISSSPHHNNSKQKILSSKLICASQLTGISLTVLSRMFGVVGLPFYNNPNNCNEMCKELWKIPTQMLEKVFIDQLKEISALKLLGSEDFGYLNFFDLQHLKCGRIADRDIVCNGIKFHIPEELMQIIWDFLPKGFIWIFGSIDGRWSKARNANECTVILCEMFWKAIIYRKNIIRERSIPSKEDDFKFIGASKCAEGYGIDSIMSWLSNQSFLGFKYELRCFIHDHDGTARNIIRKHFKNSRELLDVGHKSKNIKKHVGCWVRGWGSRVAVAFQTAVKMANDNSNILKTILNNYVNHWCGNHDKCYGDGKNCKESRVLLDVKKDTELITKLSSIFEGLANHSDSYVRSANTQRNESLNNAITRFVPKRLDFPSSYSGRADMGLLTQMKGETAVLDVMEEVGFPMSNYSRTVLKNKQYKSKYHKKRKASEEYNERRKYLKEDQRKRHSIVHAGYGYKDEEFEVESQANASQDLINQTQTGQTQASIGSESDGCNCVGACKTKKCPCKRTGISCRSGVCHRVKRNTQCTNK